MDAVITVRLDKDIKERAHATLNELGLTPSRAVQQLFEYIVRTGDLPFGGDSRPSPEEVKRRLAAFERLQLDEPLPMSDDQVRAARIKERYGIDVG